MQLTTLPNISLHISRLSMLCRRSLLPLLSFIVLIPVAWTAPKNLSEDEVARLKQGEVLLETIHGDKPGGAARVTAMFYAEAGAVWNIIGHCEYEFIYMRGLSVCEMLDGDQFQMTMHHRLHNSWFTPTLDYTFAAKRATDNHGEAHLIEGNLKVLQGNWTITSIGDSNSLIVVHEIRIQPKLPAPRWLIRRSLRKDLPDMLACIRGLARASGKESQRHVDLKRCAGEFSDVSK